MADSVQMCSDIPLCRWKDVIYGGLITVVVTVAVTVFTILTNIDFTAFGGKLFVAVIIVTGFGIICTFLPGKTMVLVYSSLGALLFSVCIVCDTQIKIKMEGVYNDIILSKEYLFITLSLSMDIFNVFAYILIIFGAARD
ncbi:protein lifeguard 1-like [Homalodisca vitripennis]|uniref:protein lifeguard 1-like n=1 Tax=Homalodisca vitripennis TaxID=197043 RepID=UPI001EEA560E|nr:protein lifeguard 1-like [Homalodisca vitripennis]